MRLALTALLLVAIGAQAADRLLIEVVPVYVSPSPLYESGEYQSEMQGFWTEGEVMVAMHEAMDLLSVPYRLYDIVMHRWDAHSIRCSFGEPGDETQCHDADLASLDLANLAEELGYDWDDLPKGKIVVLVLLKTRAFPWDGGALGSANMVTWVGWDPEDMHWTESACLVWTHLIATTIAHELGHCFGLDHTGADDANFDGSDHSFDLMAEHYSPLHAQHFKPSNRARIRQHFRKLEAPAPASLFPSHRIR